MAYYRLCGMLLLAAGAWAQAGAIDPRARKDIDAGNQAWVNGMKAGDTAPIAATYAENAVDCSPTGECQRGRAAIAEYLKTRTAKLGKAVSASAKTVGSVQQGDFVYEWGVAEVAFAGAQKIAHRYLTVWQRQPDGAWKIFRNMPIPDDAVR